MAEPVIVPGPSTYGELIAGRELEKESVQGAPHYKAGRDGEIITAAQFHAEPAVLASYVNANGNLCFVPFRFRGATGQKLEPLGWTLVCGQLTCNIAVVEQGWKPGKQLQAVIKQALRTIAKRAH